MWNIGESMYKLAGSDEKLNSLINKALQTGLRPKDFVVVGSGAIKIHYPEKFREIDDLDIAIYPSGVRRMRKAAKEGLVVPGKHGKNSYKTQDDEVEMWDRWGDVPLRKHKKDIVRVGDYQSISLDNILGFKVRANRPKDIDDIKFIRSALSGSDS